MMTLSTLSISCTPKIINKPVPCQKEKAPVYDGPEPLIKCGDKICINPKARNAWVKYYLALINYALETETLCKGL